MDNYPILQTIKKYKNILIFSDRYPHICGGSDIYLDRIIKFAISKNIKIYVIKKNHINFVKQFKLSKNKFTKIYNLENIKLPWQLKFLEARLYKRNIKNFFQNNFFNFDDTILLGQDLISVYAINEFRGNSIHLIQDLLAFDRNYARDSNDNLKIYSYLLSKIDYYINFNSYFKISKTSLKKSVVFSNSNFISKFFKKKFNINSIISYPIIDLSLKEKFNSLDYKIPKKQKGIVMVGDNIQKGFFSTLYIASKLQNYNFYIFGRSFKKKYKKSNNVFLMPWENESINIYKYAHTVIVPSLWSEPYGMVAREAFLLNLICLVRNIGGLPETVDNQKEFICNTDDDFVQKIKLLSS